MPTLEGQERALPRDFSVCSVMVPGIGNDKATAWQSGFLCPSTPTLPLRAGSHGGKMGRHAVLTRAGRGAGKGLRVEDILYQCVRIHTHTHTSLAPSPH